jgi:hypothetical protein
MKGFERFKHMIYKTQNSLNAPPKETDVTSTTMDVEGVEKARMNDTLNSFLEKVTCCHMAGQTTDESLLLEGES